MNDVPLLPFIMASLLAIVLSACAGRPGPEVLAPVSTTEPGARLVTVYVATTRERAAPDENVFTSGRAPALNFAEFTISIPPGHRAGEIEWPTSRPDPATSFVTIRQAALDESEFRRRVGRAGRAGHDVGVFVHGYNYSFQESLFRLAQLSADSTAETIPVLFAWPSEAAVTGYVADKDAVTYSRGQLAHVVTMLAQERTVRRVTVFGHSMGAWLTMEALRQLRLQGGQDVLTRLQVALAAPDIDLDVFRAQVAVIGPMSPPLTLLVSKDDRALAVSRRLSYGRERIGMIDVADPRVQEVAREAKLQIIDISEVNATDGFNHDRFVALAAMHTTIVMGDGRRDPLRQAGAFVFNTAGAALSAPFDLVGRAIAGE
jgi:esterase/lipase superfamily enzyme